MKKSKKVVIIILCIILAIIISLFSLFATLRFIGKKQFHKEDANIKADSVDILEDESITYNEKQYVLNPDVISVLFIGIDKEAISSNSSYGNNGQADVIILAAVDTKSGHITMIPISRETMTDINTYSSSGSFAGTENAQICLSYAYGTTAEESSKNVINSVKRALYGINIGSYVTMDMSGISNFTKVLGGVELVAQEDIMILGEKKFSKGQSVNLLGTDALEYIHYRTDDIDGNKNRMQRQKQFLSALISKAGNKVMGDFTLIGKYYSSLSPYAQTDITLSQATYLTSLCIQQDLGSKIEYKNIEGELKSGEEWVEFYPDEDSVIQTVISTFYKPIK